MQKIRESISSTKPICCIHLGRMSERCGKLQREVDETKVSFDSLFLSDPHIGTLAGVLEGNHSKLAQSGISRKNIWATGMCDAACVFAKID